MDCRRCSRTLNLIQVRAALLDVKAAIKALAYDADGTLAAKALEHLERARGRLERAVREVGG